MTDLYRFLDAAGRLLYVGISRSAIVRMVEHSMEKDWWDEVATVTITKYADREAAAEAEVAAIHHEAPLYNVQHAQGPRSSLAPVEHGWLGREVEGHGWHPQWRRWARCGECGLRHVIARMGTPPRRCRACRYGQPGYAAHLMVPEEWGNRIPRGCHI